MAKERKDHSSGDDNLKTLKSKVQKRGSKCGKVQNGMEYRSRSSNSLVLNITVCVLCCGIMIYIVRDNSSLDNRDNAVAARKDQGDPAKESHGTGGVMNVPRSTGGKNTETGMDSDDLKGSDQNSKRDTGKTGNESKIKASDNPTEQGNVRGLNVDSVSKAKPKKPNKNTKKKTIDTKKSQPIVLHPNPTSSYNARESDEMRNFKASTLKSLKIRNIGVEERDIHYRELTGDQPNNSSVRLYLFDNFLSSAECFGLMNAHNNHVSAANGEIGPIICFSDAGSMRNYMNEAGMTLQLTENDFSAGTICVNATISNQIGQFIKWSYSTSFYPGESVFSKRFDTRIEKATGLKSSNGGKFQLTSYPRGVGYKPHTDCIVGSTEKRDRFATILVYLQDVPKGGETVFSELNISVRPIQGRALVWNNMDSDGKCQPLSLHEAAPVIRGSKYIIQRWYYYESFYALGKRSAEPELPPRVQDQPRVSCDKYEQGSCRWYDEWNFDHIKEYQRLKRDLH